MMEVRNRDLECYEVFDVHVRRKIRSLVNDELIEEHRKSPLGPHSDNLSRVLNFLRRGPVAGKYAVYAERPFGPYRILKLTGVRGVRPSFLDERRFGQLDDVYHEIFLRRLNEMVGQEVGV